MVWQTMETEMSQHTELIVKLLKFADTLTAGIMTGHDHPNSQDELDRLNSARFLREAADALQAMERVPMTEEKGWLIECNIASGAPFWLKPDGEGTNDSNDALRFSRETDAQGFLDSFLVAKYGKDTMGIFKRHYSKEKYSVTEHMWLDSKSDKGPQ